MSWLFSQALVAEYLEGASLVDELSAPSSGIPTQQAFLSHGKTTGFSRLSRFGMTCKPLTDDHGAALLTSYLAASHARTSAQLGGGQELTAPDLVCGSKWPESSVRYDHAESKWKTAHCLWEEDLPWSSVTLPRWGMTRNGHVYQHPTAERPISATAAGLWPTPNVPNGGRAMSAEMALNGGYTLEGKKRQINLETAAKYWPNPKSNDAEKRGNFDMNNPRNGLPAAVRKFPTPTASASKGWAPNHNRASSDDRLDYTIERESFQHGQPTPPMRLNPEWVEWLMGWPLGWTDLKPLEMDRFREWQQQHSPYFLDDKEAQ